MITVPDTSLVASFAHGDGLGKLPHSIFAALVLGLLYGTLVALAPDHLGTLITLSAATDDTAAFRVGAVWGVGHALGMGLILCFFFAAERVFGFSSKGWEEYSDYIAGLSMVLCATYFILRESHYIEENTDGSQTIRACGCCPSAAPRVLKATPEVNSSERITRGSDRNHAGKAASSTNFNLGRHRCARPDANAVQQGTDQENGGEVGASMVEAQLFAWSRRDMNGAVMGIVQGFCCPMCLVGASFTSVLSTVSGCAVFAVVFLLSSMAVTGALALAWSRLTRSGGSWFSPRAAYRASCVFTMILGILWVSATAMGSHDALEWTKHWGFMEDDEQAF